MRTIIGCYYLLHVVLSWQAEINVDGLEGGEVVFQCSHKLASNNPKYFCIDSCKKSSEDVLASVASGRHAETGRVTLVDSGNGTFSVHIKYLQLSDSRLYWCAVERAVMDTYTSVNLTVHKGTAPTVISSTWTQMFTESLMTTDRKTTELTNVSIASNVTIIRRQPNDDGQKSRPRTVLYAAVGTITTLFILILATIFRKWRDSKPQPSVTCSNTKQDFEATWPQWDKILSSVNTPHPPQDPNTSANAKTHGSAHPRVYENITFDKHKEGSRDLKADEQNQEPTSRIYITLLPSAAPETKADAIKTARSERTGGLTVSAPRCLSIEENPRSLWFGLDLSAINQS